MTIEEIEREWLDWKLSDAAKYSGHIKMPAEYWADKYADKLLAVAKAAKDVWPITSCDSRYGNCGDNTCRSCDLKDALEELEK